MKIRGKLFISISVVIILIFSIGVTGIISLNSALRLLNQVEQNHIPGILAISAINNGYVTIVSIERTLINPKLGSQDRAELHERLKHAWGQIDAAREAYGELDLTANEKIVWEKFNAALEGWKSSHEILLKQISEWESKPDNSKLNIMSTQSLELNSSYAGPVEIMLDKLLITSSGEISNYNAVAKRISTATRLTIAFVVFISIVIILFLGFKLNRSISVPVNKCLAHAELLAKGNFLERIDLNLNDEFGMLGRALNSSSDSLEKLISEVILTSQNLAKTVDEIASGNENLAQRTASQASSIEEISAAIDETNASTSQNAGSAIEADTLAENSSKLAMNSGYIVEKAVLSISEINNASKKISEIINIINEIAFQTNLLALNAAVEAARAGEQGRGFAVVASEVRNLAQRSAGAAREIGALIKDSISKIEEGTELVNKSGSALKDIIFSTKQVKDIISEIATSSSEQSKGIQQISIAVGEMDEMTQQNAALVEETAAASQEMSNQARELISMVEKFKIRENVKNEI